MSNATLKLSLSPVRAMLLFVAMPLNPSVHNDIDNQQVALPCAGDGKVSVCARACIHSVLREDGQGNCKGENSALGCYFPLT